MAIGVPNFYRRPVFYVHLEAFSQFAPRSNWSRPLEARLLTGHQTAKNGLSII